MMDIFKRECDIKIEELTKERDQFRARVAELEEQCERVVSPTEPFSKYEIRDILNRSPRQSLAAIEARVLRAEADRTAIIGGSSTTNLRERADRIEQEG